MPATAIALTLLSAVAMQSKPTVAIVPTLNVSGEKWEELRKKQESKIDNYLPKAFKEKGFEVISGAPVVEAIKKLNIDFTDEEQLKRQTMFDLAKELKADYIFTPVILLTEQQFQDRDLYRDREGRTDVKIWFLDVKNQKPILSAKTYVGRSGGLRITLKPSDRQIQAAENAVKESINEAWSIMMKTK